jgi:tetratricopeptide (TPR) repeat protein
MDYSAVGPTVHLAARMEQMATPGSTRFTSVTLRLVEGMVQVNDLGPIPIKGMTEPVEVFELTGASTIRRRLQAAVARGLTKFVGRETEIDMLNQARERVEAGNGQIVAAVGEAGVGKSRLAYEFIQSHRTQGWLVLESASVSYGKATPYFPVVDLLKRYVRVEDGDAPRTVRAKVTGHILTLDENLQETIPACLSLLDALPEDSPFLQLDPPQRRRRTLDGLKRILLRESQVQPLLLVFEDLHWIDSETQALLDSLVESLPSAPILLLINYRPEYQHGWGNKTYYTQLRLDPLPPERADAFLATLLGDDASLEPLKRLLVERTAGNPFYLEETVRTLVETKVLAGKPGGYRLEAQLPLVQVPDTVQAILAARIDRLPADEKQLLQTAAVIGTEVPLPLLQMIVELPEDTLHRGLTHLQAAEFLYETSLFPDRVYTFKHALTHEVAYGSLLHERRCLLHARITEALEAMGSDRLHDDSEQLAHHAFRGELWDKAVRYYRQAGARAQTQSAYREAVMCYDQALAALQYLPENAATMEQGIDLRLEMRTALFLLTDYHRLLNTLQEAERLAEALDDPHRLCHVYASTALAYMQTSAHERAITTGERALTLARALGDFAHQVQANFGIGYAHFHIGAFQQAIAVGEWIMTSLPDQQIRERFSGSYLPSVMCRNLLAACLVEQGAFAEAVTYSEEGLSIAESVNLPIDLAVVYRDFGGLHLHRGELNTAMSFFERGLAISEAAEIPRLTRTLRNFLGYTYALAERHDDALPLLAQSVDEIASTSMSFNNQAFHLTLLSEAYLLVGNAQDATSLAMQALELAQSHQERRAQAWALRLHGDIAIRRHPLDNEQAETHYQQALSLATELGMRPLQAHCHRGLGTVYSRTGQAEQARAELSTAIDMYRDMEMTFWLPETETALAEVEKRS